ncbi:MAG: hypothetical protein K6D61_08975 [Prevotella sp.]|nr:hypothetical protein [Prevotella sp.]
MDKDNVKAWSSCLLWIVGALILYKGCNLYSSYEKEAYIEKKQNDSIRQAFIKDSLAHDPRYQDSVRKAKEQLEKWTAEQEEIDRQTIVGFMLLGDSVYHTFFHVVKIYKEHSYGFMNVDKSRLLFITKQDITNKSFQFCSECEEKEDLIMSIEDGEYIHEDDIEDYVRENIDYFREDIFDNVRDDVEEHDYREDNYRWRP